MVTLENNPLFPSEFRVDGDIYKIFSDNNLKIGRILSGSKSIYKQYHPNNIVIFNANIVTESRGKIFYGDLDLTEDKENLKIVAQIIGEPFYILNEMDARFENENKEFEFYKKRAVKIIIP